MRKGFSLPLLAFSSVLLPLPSFLFLLLRCGFFTAAVPKRHRCHHGEPPAQSAFPGLTSAASPFHRPPPVSSLSPPVSASLWVPSWPGPRVLTFLLLPAA